MAEDEIYCHNLKFLLPVVYVLLIWSEATIKRNFPDLESFQFLLHFQKLTKILAKTFMQDLNLTKLVIYFRGIFQGSFFLL